MMEDADSDTGIVTVDGATQTELMPHNPMCYEHVCDSDATMRLYTGLPNANTSMHLPQLRNKTLLIFNNMRLRATRYKGVRDDTDKPWVSHLTSSSLN